MFAFAGTSFNMGDSNIVKITSPVLLIAGDNDGLDKIELIKRRTKMRKIPSNKEIFWCPEQESNLHYLAITRF